MKPVFAIFTAVLALSCQPNSSAVTTRAANALQFSNSGVNYSIPRSYLTWPLSPKQPHLEVTYPDYRSAGNREDCWTWMGAVNRHPCRKFDFLVSGGEGGLNVMQMVQNSRRGLGETLTTGSDPNGFKTWWNKNVPEHITFFRNDPGRPLFFDCSMLTRADGSHSGVCATYVQLSDGNTASLLFPLEERGNLAQIEANIDRLMQRFRVKTSA